MPAKISLPNYPYTPPPSARSFVLGGTRPWSLLEDLNLRRLDRTLRPRIRITRVRGYCGEHPESCRAHLQHYPEQSTRPLLATFSAELSSL
ncbi:hypothetical protein BJV77DRAFT_269149 [Russula vinacea]|nr:hypothetical protein BJV77DRAFT_269149 [Russula vinacea]